MKRSRIRTKNTKRLEARRRTQFGVQADLCRALACCVCGAPAPSDPEHVRTRGAGGKDRDTVPLCRRCHDLRHDHGHFGPFRAMNLHRELPWLTSGYGWNPPMVKLADCARAFFEHVARGLEAVLSLRADTWVDCYGDCNDATFKGPVCRDCMCCRGCAGAYEILPGTGVRCPGCRL